MSSNGQGPHSLAFRVMRLCKPSFQIDPPLKLNPSDLLFAEDLFDDPTAASFLNINTVDSSDPSYSTRLFPHHPSDPIGLSGLLILPQSFGAIYLGETFSSYISINNSSNFEVKDIVIKAEIQTERQRILLTDTSKSPVESVQPGGRYDFLVEHDVKELGAHTLVCTALYLDGDGERKYLPQFFKFIVSNPLSVRTKVRVAKETTFLETCIENHTKSNLFMDQVEFEPAPHWNAIPLKAAEHDPICDSLPREMFQPPVIIRSGGGIRNYLYQLKLCSKESEQAKVQGTNVLGKLQITWRTNLGEFGRLQTQQIFAAPITCKELKLQVIELPPKILSDRPFVVCLNITNQTDRQLGPFEITLSQPNSRKEKSVMICGLHTATSPMVEALGSTDINLNLIATKPGIHRIKGIVVYDTREKKTYEPFLDVEIFVSTD